MTVPSRADSTAPMPWVSPYSSPPLNTSPAPEVSDTRSGT